MKDQDLENYINSVLAESNGMDSFEVDNLTLARRVIASHPAVKNKAAVLASIDQKIVEVKGGWDKGSSYRSDEENSVADFSVTVTRNTNTIIGAAGFLPVPIFSPISAEGAYAEVLGQSLPAGTTITSVLFGSNAGFPNQMRITYANGGNSDTIDITCNTMNYPSFLKDCNNNRFVMNRARMSVSAVANALVQFSQTVLTFTQTLFGEARTNRISLGSNITPEQFQTGIIDIPKSLPIEPNKGIIVPFPSGFANGSSFTITGFVVANRRG